MDYFGYTLQQINDCCRNYKEICSLFFDLAHDDETRNKLGDILYNGRCNDFCLSSNISSKDNPTIEARRRISMAYLLVTNPETFEVIVQNRVNLFHGTNGNALPSILKYGLHSGRGVENLGINVTTGEIWSRIGGEQRDFISFTDVLDIAEYYSTLGSCVENDNFSFEVIIGTTVADVEKFRRCFIPSSVPEVGVKNSLPLYNIKVIAVPSDKVKFVRSIIGDAWIEVVALDDIREKFFWFDEDCGRIDISYDKFNELKDNLRSSSKGKFFRLEELRKVMVKWIISKVMKHRKKNGVFGSEGLNGRVR